MNKAHKFITLAAVFFCGAANAQTAAEINNARGIWQLEGQIWSLAAYCGQGKVSASLQQSASRSAVLAKTIKWNDGKGIAANAMAEMQDILSNDSSINKRVACTNMSPLFGRLLTQRAENEKLTASHAKERGKLTVDRALQMVMAEADAEAKELQGMVNVTEALQAAQQKKQSCKAVNHKQRMPIYETVCDNHNKCEYKITRYQDNYSTEQVCN